MDTHPIPIVRDLVSGSGGRGRGSECLRDDEAGVLRLRLPPLDPHVPADTAPPSPAQLAARVPELVGLEEGESGEGFGHYIIGFWFVLFVCCCGGGCGESLRSKCPGLLCFACVYVQYTGKQGTHVHPTPKGGLWEGFIPGVIYMYSEYMGVPQLPAISLDKTNVHLMRASYIYFTAALGGNVFPYVRR
jgi:hypothetical protein